MSLGRLTEWQRSISMHSVFKRKRCLFLYAIIELRKVLKELLLSNVIFWQLQITLAGFSDLAENNENKHCSEGYCRFLPNLTKRLVFPSLH